MATEPSIKKSTAALITVAAFILGVVTGLFIAAYKGPPPGLTAGSMPPKGPMASNSQTNLDENPVQMAEVQSQLTALKEKIKANPAQVELYVEAGNLLFDHNLHEQAITYYEQALEIGGENPDILTDAGISYRHLGKSQKAVDFFRRARKANSKHENSALNLGIVLFHDLKDNKAALEAWRDYLALNPQGQRADMIRRVVKQIEEEQKTK
ncbi:MAG: tetratricopeptide repeat protein [Deltaproteobacteria bacterium]|nr:tetratricopeptide repeat protein [Deltaproteobacteria bacterium]